MPRDLQSVVSQARQLDRDLNWQAHAQRIQEINAETVARLRARAEANGGKFIVAGPAAGLPEPRKPIVAARQPGKAGAGGRNAGGTPLVATPAEIAAKADAMQARNRQLPRED